MQYLLKVKAEKEEALRDNAKLATLIKTLTGDPPTVDPNA
jgi:hypothetical protein